MSKRCTAKPVPAFIVGRSPISPFLSNVMLNELDKEMERLNLKFVRYADDFSIYCKTKSDAVKANRLVIKFLKDKLKLPINTDKSGIRRPIHLQVLGFGFIRKHVLFIRRS